MHGHAETAVTSAAALPGKEKTMLRLMVERFLHHRMATVGLFVLLVIAAAAIAAPFIYGDSYVKIPLDRLDELARRPPSLVHPFGTDEMGRDALARVLVGGRVSLAVGFIAAALSVTIGSIIGALAGFYRGWIDNLLMRLTEVISVLPFFFLVIAIVAFIGPNVYTVPIVIGLVGWTGVARLVRGEFLALSQREFVEAARAAGLSDLRIIFRHMLPNALAPIVVAATLTVADAIITESALSYFGLGVPLSIPTWGNMLNGAQAYFYRAPWLAIFPGLMIVLTVMCINFVGDGLRDALDPRLKG